MDLDEVLSPYFKNFRRIFYKQTEQGEERLSVIKLMLVGVYLLATLFAFLQFSVIEPVLQPDECQEVAVVPSEEEISVLDCQIQMTIFGQIAHSLNVLLLLGILCLMMLAYLTSLPQSAVPRIMNSGYAFPALDPSTL